MNLFKSNTRAQSTVPVITTTEYLDLLRITTNNVRYLKSLRNTTEALFHSSGGRKDKKMTERHAAIIDKIETRILEEQAWESAFRFKINQAINN